MIEYRDQAAITAEQAIDLYKRSTLGERRPIDNIQTFEAMLGNANLTITAWDGEKLIGISRTLTDFAYVAYLADLAVDQEYQRSGIGKQLIEETKFRLGPECMIVLVSIYQCVYFLTHFSYHNWRTNYLFFQRPNDFHQNTIFY